MKRLFNELKNENSTDELNVKESKWYMPSNRKAETPKKKKLKANNYKLKSSSFIFIIVLSFFVGGNSFAQVQTEKASNHSVLTRQLNLVMEKAMQLKGGNIINKMDQENSLKDLETNLNDASNQMSVISDMTPNFKKENESMKKHLMKATDHLKELKTEIEKAIPDQSKVKSHAGELYNEVEKAQEDHKELKMKAEK
jgi:hypothetical protein